MTHVPCLPPDQLIYWHPHQNPASNQVTATFFPTSQHAVKGKMHGEYKEIRKSVTRRNLRSLTQKYIGLFSGVGRDSSVGIATCNGRIPVEARFPAPVQTSFGTQPAFSLPRVKRLGNGVVQPLPCSVALKLKRMYIHTPTSPLGLHGQF